MGLERSLSPPRVVQQKCGSTSSLGVMDEGDERGVGTLPVPELVSAPPATVNFRDAPADVNEEEYAEVISRLDGADIP